jgi:hypothetical protein
MKTLRRRSLSAGVAACAALLCGAVEMRAQPRPFEETVSVHGTAYAGMGDFALSFSAPVALPGLSLRSGTYNFHAAAIHVMQVTSADGRLNSMFSTISTVRSEPTDHFAIVLGPPSGPDSPRRILSIFAPGELTGEQFVYSTR